MDSDKELVSDKDLDKDDRAKAQTRKHRILDALCSTATVAIYIVPLTLGALYVAVLIHQAWTGEWVSLESTLRGMIVPVTTYMAGLLSQNVISKNNGN